MRSIAIRFARSGLRVEAARLFLPDNAIVRILISGLVSAHPSKVVVPVRVTYIEWSSTTMVQESIGSLIVAHPSKLVVPERATFM